ncbi:MAG: RNA polymerase sigma factor [Bacteroidetes bacterium]|nr:RNA polymerase sigma factor [Bacteroidota bacterium]MDA1335829.1 RNA polymerase sigma factor [Bacteroidota bacterium]
MWIALEIDDTLDGIQDPVAKELMEEEINSTDPYWTFVQGCLEGDSMAQRGLFDRLLPYLKSAVRRYIWDDSDVQDVLQEAFIRIFRNLHQFDPKKGQVQTWATRIAVNAAITFGMRGMRQSNHEAISNFNASGQREPEVLAQLNAEDLLQRLRALPREQYEVLILHSVEGYSHDEIAALLHVSSMTSRKRLSRAKQWIASRFDLEGGELIPKKTNDHETD